MDFRSKTTIHWLISELLGANRHSYRIRSIKFIGKIYLMVVQRRVRLVQRNHFETNKFAAEEISNL